MQIDIARQRGSALIFSLVILLVMTLIGISSMSSATLEETMAANDRAQKLAFQNAERVLRQAEQMLAGREYLGDLENQFNNPDEAGFIALGAVLPDPFDPASWTPNATCAEVPDDNGGPSPGCYMVEQVELNAPVSHIKGAQYSLITRITARGVAMGGNAVAILQAYHYKDLAN